MSRYAKNDARRVGRFLNSGIPGHAFYLLATKLGGYAWEKAGMIWYRALSSKAVTPGALDSEIAERITGDGSGGFQ
jgi:Zn-dependent metalloprotease